MEAYAVEPPATAGRSRSPLHAMLGHVELVAAKRLSDRGRRRLKQLEVRVRLLTRLLDAPTAGDDPPSAPVDPITLRQMIWELDAVLNEEGSRPLFRDGASAPFRTRVLFRTPRA